MSKTVYSLPEYKFLDKCIKKHFPKHCLAIWWMNTTNSLQIVAAPKYTGYMASDIMPQDEKSEVYSFSMGKFLSCDYIHDSFPDVYWLTQGFSIGAKYDLLLYIHNNQIFKYGIPLFKELFKIAATISNHSSTDEIRLKRCGALRKNESPFITNDCKLAFHAVPASNYSFEELVINNDLII